MKKSVIISVLAFCVSVFYALAAGFFTDVTEANYGWAYEAIESFAEKGIVNGMGDGTFNPGGSVTREQFAKMLLLTFNKEPEQDAAQTFSDVSSDSWAFAYIEAVKDCFPGYADNSFRPQEPAKREDIAAALVRSLESEVTDSDYAEETFSDFSDITEDMKPYVSAAAEKGLVNGYPDGTFKPQSGITRAETVVMLERAMNQWREDESAPKISLINCPDTTDKANLKITGIVTDNSGKTPSLTVNGKPVTVGKDGSFSTSVSLKAGKNEITFAAKNSEGKSDDVSRIITRLSSTSTETVDDGYAVVVSDAVYSMEDYSILMLWDGKDYFSVSTTNGETGDYKRGTIIYGYYFSDSTADVELVEKRKTGAIVAADDDGKIVTIRDSDTGKTTHYAIDPDDTTVLYVDTDRYGTDTGLASGEFSLAMEKDDGSYTNNAYYVVNDDDELECILVDQALDLSW